MVDATLVTRARKARYDDLPNFSGHPSEDAERFLKNIKNITKANDDSSDHQILEIVRGKLTQTAGTWFDDHESQFTKWSDFDRAFRNRYVSTTIIRTKFDKLTQRKQRHDESITSYYDEIVNLCREIDSNMSDKIIIQHLMSGIKPEFQKEILRRKSSMQSLTDFLEYAKIEQDLHDTFERSKEMTRQTSQPYFKYNPLPISQCTATTQQEIPNYYNIYRPSRQSYSKTTQSSDSTRNSMAKHERQYLPTPLANYDEKPRTANRSTVTVKFDACKICGLHNHRSIDCIHKCSFGCYNCGQNHSVRDCSQPPYFQ
jgi:hypothetical protein